MDAFLEFFRHLFCGCHGGGIGFMILTAGAAPFLWLRRKVWR